MKRHFMLTATALLATSALAGISSAQAGEGGDALKKMLIDDAKPYIDARYRFENVDQDGMTEDADASTLRTKLGYKTGELNHFSATVEVENVTVVGNDSYNDTVNGKVAYPIVADPASTELNHVFVTYTGLAGTTLQVGRQPHNLDNQRFIGTVGWRQNDQTYDAAMISNTSIQDTTLIYSFVNNVNRINGDDHPLGDLETSTQVFNASYAGLPFGKITGYGYLIDLEEPAVYGLSSKTFGLRFAGDHAVSEAVKLLYAAEYAGQSDYADNPTNYSADYSLLEGGVSASGVTAKLGYEVLGSDNNGTVSFQTPLATLHKFNGWADKFLSTPAAGLEDIYADLSYKVGGTGSVADGAMFQLVYHDFTADTGGADYGTEWDALVSYPFADHYTAALKYADYEADSFATDTQKFWFELGAKF